MLCRHWQPPGIFVSQGKYDGPVKIYAEGINPAPAPQPMDVVSADYLTVDDATDNEGLQNEGIYERHR